MFTGHNNNAKRSIRKRLKWLVGFSILAAGVWQIVQIEKSFHRILQRFPTNPQVTLPISAVLWASQDDQKTSRQLLFDQKYPMIKTSVNWTNSATGSLHQGDDHKSNITGSEWNFRSMARKPVLHAKYLIYVCDFDTNCRGWADRQKGLVGAYLLAHVTQRTFGVIMNKPCDINQFYIPNQINWNIQESELRGKLYVTIHRFLPNKLENLSSIDFNKQYPQDVVLMKTNTFCPSLLANNPYYYPFQFPTWAINASDAAIFREAWTILMKPSEGLKGKLHDFLKKIKVTSTSKPFVCAHVRVGRSSTLTRDSRNIAKISHMKFLWRFLESYLQNGSLLFLSTDSNQVRMMGAERFGDRIHHINGKILHIDQQANEIEACSGFEAALLDNLILTQCDVLVRTPFSGFSRNAVYLGKKNVKVFQFANKTITEIRKDFHGLLPPSKCQIF